MSELENPTSGGNVEENNEPNTSNLGSRRASKEVIFIGDAPPNSQVNLQASFLKFRDQKIKEMQMMKMAKQASLTTNRTPEFKDALRKKFVETAKKYLGVPYALRYKNPEDPIAPMYLDCCALVRQALLDLQEEFGFSIGRWNQCYQIDTLPIVLSQEELKPGDLIFYEGEYYSNRSKPQKHNMVHVEIFLGGESGEECIGSRYHRGKVSIFPSFKFTSTTWKLVNFHFRSIDTWLDGVCKSCCPEHPWQSDSLNYLEAAGKRSIFSDGSMDDVDAGGDEDDENVCIPCADSEETAATPLVDVNDENEEERQQNDQNGNRDTNGVTVVTEAGSSIPVSSTMDSSTGKSGKSTNPGGSTKVKRPSPYRSGSNNDIDSSQKKAGATSATSAAGSTSASSKIPGRSSKNDSSRSYYVGKSNGWRLVKDALDKRGWTQLPFDYQFSTRFGLKWVERRSQIDYRAHQPGQLVCHIPNNDVLCTKIGLLSVMRDYFQGKEGTSLSNANASAIPWIPETYDLELPSDIHQLLQKEEQRTKAVPTVTHLSEENPTETSSQQPAESNIWIYKPAACNRGRGIRVVSGLETLRGICMGEEHALIEPSSGSTTGTRKTESMPAGPSSGLTNAAHKVKGVIQRYITNPLLVHGCKFDIRCYLLIARNYPTTFAFYHSGYCRMALKPYPTTMAELTSSLEDTMMHLTNASVQKKSADYASMGSSQIQSMAQIIEHMKETNREENANYIESQLNRDIMLCMADLLRASNGKFLRKHGYFDLLGCDFMITSDNKLHLLEVNTNPAMSLDNDVLESLLPKVIDGALGLVLQTQGPDILAENGGDINNAIVDIEKAIIDTASETGSEFKLIFDESRNWYYSG